MNFFEDQEAARRTTRRLVWLFAAAVVAIVIAVNFALGAIYLGALARHGAWSRLGLAALPPYFVPTTTAVVLLMIFGGSALEILSLREGGEAVARMIGARAVDPATRDLAERRLLNVIEEMALASGIGAPRAYVLDGEHGINAFAAGLDTHDAVVTVTRGTLARLNRDELQGVIGHEFSHILNGDMKLNVRLIGVLQGLLMLALFGRFLMSIGGSGRDRRGRGSGGALLAAGLAVLVIGYIGVFFGRLIKASVSRQREFLADASSVQFTRNPEGIGRALRKIGALGDGAGGGAIEHMHAETLSHMFMAPVSQALAGGWLATHPPLPERIRRVYGRPMDYLAAPEEPAATVPDATPELPPLPFPVAGAGAAPAAAPEAARAVEAGASPVGALVAGAGAVSAGADVHAAIGKPAAAARPFAEMLRARIDELGLGPALSDPVQAQLLVLGMLIDQDRAISARQDQLCAQVFGAAAAAQAEAYRATLAQLPAGWRLALLDAQMPALRALDAPARQKLLQISHQLIVADGRVTLAEFLLFTVLKRRLGASRSARPARYLKVEETAAESALVMSLIAAVRLPQQAQRAFDAGRAVLPEAGVMVAHEAIELARVAAAVERLNALAPLEKPRLIKACLAVAFVDGSTDGRAASCLRTLCTALDCPLPPQVELAESEQTAAVPQPGGA
jgi:Zn-dependent protease with chaperone function